MATFPHSAVMRKKDVNRGGPHQLHHTQQPSHLDNTALSKSFSSVSLVPRHKLSGRVAGHNAITNTVAPPAAAGGPVEGIVVQQAHRASARKTPRYILPTVSSSGGGAAAASTSWNQPHPNLSHPWSTDTTTTIHGNEPQAAPLTFAADGTQHHHHNNHQGRNRSGLPTARIMQMDLNGSILSLSSSRTNLDTGIGGSSSRSCAEAFAGTATVNSMFPPAAGHHQHIGGGTIAPHAHTQRSLLPGGAPLTSTLHSGTGGTLMPTKKVHYGAGSGSNFSGDMSSLFAKSKSKSRPLPLPHCHHERVKLLVSCDERGNFFQKITCRTCGRQLKTDANRATDNNTQIGVKKMDIFSTILNSQRRNTNFGFGGNPFHNGNKSNNTTDDPLWERRVSACQHLESDRVFGEGAPEATCYCGVCGKLMKPPEGSPSPPRGKVHNQPPPHLDIYKNKRKYPHAAKEQSSSLGTSSLSMSSPVCLSFDDAIEVPAQTENE